MNAFAELRAMETPLKPVPLFPVEPKDKGKHSETTRTLAFDKMLRGVPQCKWAVPNASKRGLKAQRQVKREGMRAGVFDKHYAFPSAWIAFLEWKDGRGDLSDQQIEWGNEMVALGFRVACVRTPEFAMALFREWGAPVKAVAR